MMLANLLALAVALGSLGLYLTAFLYPDVHRKHDFIWSGLGLFYGLVLWICADQVQGVVLLGQTAAFALIVGLGWQVVLARRDRKVVTWSSPTAAKPAPVDSDPSNPSDQTAWAGGSRAAAGLQNGKGPPIAPAVLETAPRRVMPPSPLRAAKRSAEYEFVEDSSWDSTLEVLASPVESLEPLAAGLDQLVEEGRASEQAEGPSGAGEPEIGEPEVDQPETGQRVDGEPGAAEVVEVGAVPSPSEAVTASDQALTDSLPETALSSVAGELEDSPARWETPPPQPNPGGEFPSPSVPTLAPPQRQWFEKIIIIKDWLGDVVRSLRRSRPPQPMIELPARPPSIPRPPKPQAAAKLDASSPEFPSSNGLGDDEDAPSAMITMTASLETDLPLAAPEEFDDEEFNWDDELDEAEGKS